MEIKDDVREESDEESDSTSGVEAVPGIDDDLVIGNVTLFEFALFKIVILRVALLLLFLLFDRE